MKNQHDSRFSFRSLPGSVKSGAVLAIVTTLSLSAGTHSAQAQITIAPQYQSNYSFADLGAAPGVTTPYGGLTLLNTNPNVLLLGGAANGSSAGIFSVNLTRSNVNGRNRITGFTGNSTQVANVPGINGGGGIDGGLAYAPNGTLLYTSYSDNSMGELKSGSTNPDKQIDLTPFGITGSVGTLGFVPTGAPGAGHFKIASYNGGTFYDVALTQDAGGTYTVTGATQTATGLSGPEGFIYVPAGSPGFTNAAMLVSEYSSGRVSAFDVDALGNPLIATRRDFITGLSGAEGAFLDASTGDFLFSTFGGASQVISVRGFAAASVAAPEPGSVAFVLLPLLGVFVARRRRG